MPPPADIEAARQSESGDAYPRGVQTVANEAYLGLRREIVERVPTDARVIVDVGAANGVLGEHLLAQRAGRLVIGIEFDPELAGVAAHRLSVVHCADAEDVQWDQLATDQVDCLIFSDVLEHLRDPWLTLSHAVEIVAPDGTVIISIPNIRHLSALWSIFIRGSFPRRHRGLFDRSHLRWFTERDARDLCESAGLIVLDVDHRLRLLDRSGGLLNRLTSAQRWIRHVPVLRELLAYQLVITARRAPDPPTFPRVVGDEPASQRPTPTSVNPSRGRRE